MKYELSLFYSVVAGELSPFTCPTDTLTQFILEKHPTFTESNQKERIELYDWLLNQEVERLKAKLSRKVFKSCHKKIKEYIQNQQLAIEYLKQLILENLRETKRNKVLQLEGNFGDKDILKVTYMHLDVLLSFIEKHFPHFINKTFLISFCTCFKASEEIKEKLKALEIILSRSTIDPALISIVTTMVDDHSPLQEEGRFSYDQIAYYHSLIKSIEDSFERSSILDAEEKLIKVLYMMNFNSEKFISYLSAYMSRQIEGLDYNEEKLDKLFYFLRLFRQLSERGFVVYNPNELGLKNQIIQWIREEIKFYRTLQVEAKNAPKEIISEEGVESEEKIDIRLSVEGLSLFIRALNHVGLITTKNKSTIFRVFSKHFRSTKSPDISFKSLRNKYYEKGDTQQTEVRKIFQDSLNFLSKPL